MLDNVGPYRHVYLGMRSLLPFLLCFGLSWAAAQDTTPPKEPPRTLEEAHEQLEKLFSKEDLARIDAMKSDKEMSEYAVTVGVAITHQWGLWGGSALANNLWALGFNHPDDMATLILQTFWCQRHNRRFHLDDRAEYFQAYRKAVADPPATARDPADQSEIDWTHTFDASSEDTPRKIHVGRSKKTGRWLAYEHNKGVYMPDAHLIDRVKVFAHGPLPEKK